MMGQSKNKQTKKKKRKKQHNEIKQNKTTVTTRTKKFGTITTFFIYFNYEILGQKYLNLKSSQFSLMVMKNIWQTYFEEHTFIECYEDAIWAFEPFSTNIPFCFDAFDFSKPNASKY